MKNKYPKYTPDPLFATLPDYLKDPANYFKIKRALLETISCPKLHSEPKDMIICQRCTENMRNRRILLRKLGFASPAQYMKWQKVMEYMINPERRDSLLKKESIANTKPIKKHENSTNTKSTNRQTKPKSKN